MLISLWENSSDNLSVFIYLLVGLLFAFCLLVFLVVFLLGSSSALSEVILGPPTWGFWTVCHCGISICCCSVCLYYFSDLSFSKVLVLILLNHILSKKRGKNGMPYEFSHPKGSDLMLSLSSYHLFPDHPYLLGLVKINYFFFPETVLFYFLWSHLSAHLI